jgi:hypothetical protein
MQPDTDHESEPAPIDAGVKRPYAAPRVEESGAFERLVLFCAQKPKQSVPCDELPSSG